ncbi:PREDICTED: condensin-2 complex subunit H2-like [Populus euphratica]|uniref:Condensin-2 complex subunit H2 n=1 Tax=Populus euphratica TaxID=75702 RepID=A0AAJ6X9P8_POPEU|nr:PREDICTED: condensin-2 complex subunit H2-like [Populus euphratica]
MINNNKEEASKYHTVQAERDLEANWEVDLSKKLEDYLLKICSGEIAGNEEDSNVNFAEAALLLQGSVQVYSRKVEYLYNLVLHALDFLSQKRQQEQSEGTSVQTKQNGSCAVSDEENDQFWVSDDVPVEARNCLDASTSKDASFYHFVKPPANLVVLEGDCLDTSGDGGELESYLLATNDLYQDFILLDPCDALAINDFLKADDAGKAQNGPYRGSSIRKTFQSPARRSGGTANKPSLGKNRDANPMPSPVAGCSFGVNDCKIRPDPPVYDNFDENPRFDMEDRYSDPENAEDSDDNDDPWKPLNPHEPGNLKVKPFKKVKDFRRNGLKSAEKTSITALFPLARMHGTISPDLAKIWEAQQNEIGKHGNTQSPTLYEKLRQSLTNEGHNIPDTYGNSGIDNEDNAYDTGIPDFGLPDEEISECMNEDSSPPLHEKHDDGGTHFDTYKDFGHGDQRSQASLEDLCRSHLDALLANIAETEKQTELAARVSSWKQKIEQNLEEQDSHPPFDIHAYGERIVDKLSLETDSQKNVMAFTDVVKGQEKHDVARTFSALLQLVNNGEVDFDRSQANTESFCYTAINPFHVRLLGHKKEKEGRQFQLSKKRVKSPIRKGGPKLGKNGNTRCTPEGKKRRRSRVVEPVDLHSAG